jgi:hypothetical protein
LPDNLDKIFLCSITRESGDSTYFDSVSLEDNYPFFFKKVNKRIQLIHKNVLFRADKDKPVFRALERGVSDSIVVSAPIASKPEPKTGAVLVPLGDLFLIDRQNIAQELNESSKADFGLNKEDSYFSIIKSFPDNTDIEVTLNFRCNKPVSSPTSPDARSLILRYYYSLSRIPENNYVPRLADDRVGHFITMYQDYSSMKTETPYVRYVERWHLEKLNPDAELSPPKKPITFWLEKTIPLEYRDSIKKGVLAWNKAFEKIGFKDAIVVNQQPDDADWDPADSRYNTIRWMIRPGNGYAVGPSHANPFTGELYNADIRISADMVRHGYTGFEEVVNPLRFSYMLGNSKHCDYAYGLMMQAAFGWSLLEARGFLDGKEEEAEKYVQDYLLELAMHEVGHTLGFRHNFKGSSVRTFEQLNNKDFTAKEGLVGSIMDYNPVNLALDPKNQGEFWQSTPGPYDYWVVEYAYKPFGAKSPEEELPKLKEIASRNTEKDLAYGTDEDTFGNSPRGIDPTACMFDMGDDALEYAKIRVALCKELWGKIEEKFTKPGERYVKMRRVFGHGIGNYSMSGMILARYVGGIYHKRDHMGEKSNSPLKPVEAEKQKAALDFIIKNIFSLSEENFPPAKVLNKLAPDMMPDFSGSSWKASSTDIQIHNIVLGIQKNILEYLHNPFVLNRLNEMRLKVEKGNNVFGLKELFDTIKDGIGSEVVSKENINSFRRNLQREYVELLIRLFKSPTENIPSDAISLAGSNLAFLKDSIAIALGDESKFDEYTKAHLKDILSRITAVLEWKSGVK